MGGHGKAADEKSWSNELCGSVEGCTVKWTEYSNGSVAGTFTCTIDPSTLLLTGSGTLEDGKSLRFQGKKLTSDEAELRKQPTVDGRVQIRETTAHTKPPPPPL